MRIVLIGLAALVALALLGIGGTWLALNRPDVPYAELEAAYANEESQYLDLPGGVRMHYREEGAPTGRTLVLIHGFSASLHTWDAWVERLKNRYRIVRLDLPGHGLTQAPKDFTPSTQAYGDLVDQAMETLALPPAVIVGSSMGGNVAWDFARRYPHRTAALVLVGASGWPENFGEGAGVRFGLLRDPIVGPILRNLDTTELVRTGLQDSFVDDAFVTDAMVERYVMLSRAPGHRAILGRIILEPALRTTATPELVGEIAVPTLVLHGAQDNLVPVEGGELFAAHIANAQLIVYQGVGHLPQEEIPDRSAEDLVAFLDGALPADPTGGIGAPLSVDPGGRGKPLIPATTEPAAPLEGVY